jgi:hypothetical protein
MFTSNGCLNCSVSFGTNDPELHLVAVDLARAGQVVELKAAFGSVALGPALEQERGLEGADRM